MYLIKSIYHHLQQTPTKCTLGRHAHALSTSQPITPNKAETNYNETLHTYKARNTQANEDALSKMQITNYHPIHPVPSPWPQSLPTRRRRRSRHLSQAKTSDPASWPSYRLHSTGTYYDGAIPVPREMRSHPRSPFARGPGDGAPRCHPRHRGPRQTG